jgi:hypothetical protein
LQKLQRTARSTTSLLSTWSTSVEEFWVKSVQTGPNQFSNGADSAHARDIAHDASVVHQLAPRTTGPARWGMLASVGPCAAPPWVSTQVGSPQLLDPPQLLPRPRPPTRSPKSGRPRRPLAPGIHCSLWFLSRGVIVN